MTERYHGYLRDFILNIAPDFCWCTAKDLFLMCEQLYEDVSEEAFTVTLCSLRHHFETKPWPGYVQRDSERGRPGGLYLRRSNANGNIR